MSKPDTDLLSTKDVAALTGESYRQTIRRIEAGALTPAHKLPGLRGAFLFTKAAVDAYIAERDAAPAAEPAQASA
jgi:hypothetical protein